MITKPKTMPELRFQGFDAPWKISTIAELGKVVTGGTPNTSDRSLYGGYFMFVSPSDIGDARYVNTTTKTLTEAGHKTGRRIPKGSIVFVCIGSTIGKVAQVVAECTTNQQINAVIPNGNHDANFLLCVLDKEAAQIRLLAGKQAVPIINKSTFAAISITIPTLPEQRKIADFLTAVDRRIAQLCQKKALLEEYKKGVMQQLFTQALRFKDDHGNDFPDWEEKTLAEICKCFSGSTPSSGKRDYYGGSIPFIRSAEIDAERTALFLTEKGLKESAAKMVEAGDLLVALYGANSGEVGISKITGAINQAILCVRSKQSVRFLYFWLEFSKQSIVNTYLQGGQGNLSGKIVQALNIEIPSLPEQTKIANFLTALDRKIESVSQQIRHTQAFKKGLLQQMFV
jgi:type I restriction enzyme, S subunit